MEAIDKMRRDGIETRKKILSVCVRLIIEQGYKETSVSRIVEEAGISRGSYQNQFPTKDAILKELVKTMFGGQFGMARSISGEKLPPVYAYAVETAIQLTLTELNENLREIYIEAYSLPATWTCRTTTASSTALFTAWMRLKSSPFLHSSCRPRMTSPMPTAGPLFPLRPRLT